MSYQDLPTNAGRYVLYARKSTEQDERQTQSIGSQKTRAVEIAERNGRQIVDTLEESKSAKEPGRPIFGELIRRIDAGEIDGVIAWHPDRLARNEIDAAAITFRIRKGKLKELIFVEYTFINSPEGIMMLQMALSQGQYQVSKLAIEVTREASPHLVVARADSILDVYDAKSGAFVRTLGNVGFNPQTMSVFN